MIRAITIAAPAGKLAGRVLAGICKNSEIISGSFAVGLMCELWRGKVPKNFQLAINFDARSIFATVDRNAFQSN